LLERKKNPKTLLEATQDNTAPLNIGWVAIGAGIAQVTDDFPEYDQGAAGYGKRFGAGLADEVKWQEGSYRRTGAQRRPGAWHCNI